jgi:hypothetical protein
MSEYDGIFPLKFSNPYIYDTPACHTTHPYKELNNQGSIYLHMLHKDVICYTTIVNDQCKFLLMLPCGGCQKNCLSALIVLYTTLVSCIALGCHVDTYMNRMSKSQTTKIFWGDIHVFPIYLTCSLGGRETNICVPSSALMQSLKCGYAHLSFLILL